jgi:hypothetical protein
MLLSFSPHSKHSLRNFGSDFSVFLTCPNALNHYESICSGHLDLGRGTLKILSEHARIRGLSHEECVI